MVMTLFLSRDHTSQKRPLGNQVVVVMALFPGRNHMGLCTKGAYGLGRPHVQ